MPPKSRKRLDLDPPTSGRPPKKLSSKPPPFKRLNIEIAEDCDDLADSGPRHTRTRGVSASVRRERSDKLKCAKTVVDGVEVGLEGEVEDDDLWDDMGAYSGSSESEQEAGCVEAAKSSKGDAPEPCNELDVFLSGNVGEQVDEDEDEVDASKSSSVNWMRGKRGRFVGSKASVSKGVKKSSKTKKDDSWVVKGPMGGGPRDGSLIPSYGGHVAVDIWEGVERRVLKCQNRVHTHEDLSEWRLERMSRELREALKQSGLEHLPHVAYASIDEPLISAFVERWQPDTNTFHMPFGEMTITLHDVWHILRIPIDGRMVERVDDSVPLRTMYMELLQLESEAELDEEKSPIWKKGCVSVDEILCKVGKAKNRAPDIVLKGYLLCVLGTTLFTEKSGSRLMGHLLHELDIDVSRIGEYSWGSAALAYLYRQLGIASRADCAGIGGFLTLLQAWIYEYFPCFRHRQGSLAIADTDARCSRWDCGRSSKDHHRLISFRSRLDQMTAGEVVWLPFGPDPEVTVPRTLYLGRIGFRSIIEAYNPERVLRQFGRIQCIPPVPDLPIKATRPRNVPAYNVTWDVKGLARSWNKYVLSLGFTTSNHLRLDDPKVARLGPNWCVEEYMDWFFLYSHPILVRDGSGCSNLVGNLRTHTDYWMSRCIDAMKGLMIEVDNETSPYTMEAKAIISDWEDLLS